MDASGLKLLTQEARTRKQMCSQEVEVGRRNCTVAHPCPFLSLKICKKSHSIQQRALGKAATS